MASSEDFYLLLPSNASPDVYPDNTTSSYKTELPKQITLSGGGWTVALVEIAYTNTLENINPGNNEVVFAYQDEKKLWKKDVEYMASGRFRSVQSVLDELNVIIRRQVEKYAPELFPTTEFFTLSKEGIVESNPIVSELELESSEIHVRLCEGLAKLLGFQECAFFLCKGSPHQSVTQPDLRLGTPPLCYVYCDLLEPMVVGHTQVPLLRCIPVAKAEYGDITSHAVDFPIYQTLATREFSTVQIDLREHTGNPMPFEFGHSTVLLHFKRRSA